ncbi:phospholipid/cholesterol/gamma-HCH transport system substrate-binding protein [Jatrophihabitans endophyticus]|uniref:Phospholipid/cholesterol/gamma-HCH transport system substrate-binding protein n=1 Tax=Jatrophihabitans endophyticus TaxID=1206085 RepID=A0A1M5GQ92_9ACTN|nr:MCE family protein [Jatrophihabitans endophyticus]SHG05876.1 phospholipid/cholesterol/gamma-HCH transport system substrate-binding protein [Jatrophihabitans endophyticus]
MAISLRSLTKNVGRLVVLVVVAAVVVGGALYFLAGDDMKKVSARFPAAVGIYEGTPVRQLGVNIGDVTSVTPKGSYVEIGMEYESQYSLPRNSTAVEVANSLVSDRFIQLSAYPGSGPKLADGAAIPLSRTGAPAELDDIYKALNTLSVALGPNKTNKQGALSTLLQVGAANLKGNGAALGQSIANLSQAAKTLATGRKDLFGTVTNLRKFTGALKASDGQVRKFNLQLKQVAGDLAAERGDLGAALKQLGLALDEVNSFVKKNASKFHKDVTGLREITGVLVKQKGALTETLALAPVALANIVHAYQPNLGVLATRGNLASLTDPGQLCVIIKVATDKVADLGGGVLGNVLGPLTKTIVNTCTSLIKGSKQLTDLLDDPDLAGLGDRLSQLLGGLPGLVQGGS